MKIEIKELDQLQREVSIEIPAETVNEKMEKKFIEVRKKADLKGFRPGKAPMNVIKQTYSNEVKADVLDDLLKESYPKAIKEKNLNVASYPTVTFMDLNDTGDFKYTAKVEVFPKLEKVELDGLEIEKLEVEVKDEEVKEYLEMLQKQHSSLNKVERPIKENDTVVIDLQKIKDPKLVLKEDNFPASVIDLSNKFTIKEFKENLPGMNIGDEKDITINYADDYSDKKFAGAEITYHCIIKEINERSLITIDDAFAKTVKMGETVLEMRLKIREDIKNHKEEEIKKHKNSSLISQMVKINKIPVPQAVLDDYLNKIVEDYKKQEKEFNEEEIRNQYRAVGESTFQWNMLYHHLANEEKIEVLPSDTENLIMKLAENYKMTPEQTKDALQKSGKITDIRESILEEKILDFLSSKAKVVEKKK